MLNEEQPLAEEALKAESAELAAEEGTAGNNGSSATTTGLHAKDPANIKVTVGLPSESNVKQDLAVALTYNDNFFQQPSSTFNNDLAYASTCMAAAADNSNEGGGNYSDRCYTQAVSFSPNKDGGYYIAKTPLPEGVADEDFDVLYYGDNENLITKEGVTLQGWVTEAEDDEEMTGFLPDDFINYELLPDGDIVDLYAAWLDPLVYGYRFHANRSDSDGYVVNDAQLTSDDSTLAINGLSSDDEGMQNPGKTFVGWNSEPDGSGTRYVAGEQATPAQLNLGDRDQYLQDLQNLANVQTEEAPNYYEEDTDPNPSEAEQLETELEAKYTADLYAQWAASSEQAVAESDTTGTTEQATTTTRAETPHTGDTQTMLQIGALVVAAAAASLLAARRLRKD